MKRCLSFIIALFSLLAVEANGEEGRNTISLSGNGWLLWKDTKAEWENDRLYLPEEINDLSLLPVNAPTGGWKMLENNLDAIPVSVPGTVEEYMTLSDAPQPDHSKGVSWWYRKITIPTNQKGKRFILHFESVRMRAEVYLDGKLVAYDLVGESPFQTDVTDYIVPGKELLLAVRVTNPGGNFHWQDFTMMKWGNYNIPPGRGFSGLIGRVKLDCVHAVHIDHIYMQNTPVITQVNAVVSVLNQSTKEVKADMEWLIYEKGNKDKIVYRKEWKKCTLPVGNHEMTLKMEVPDAKVWDLDKPELYTCKVIVKKGKKIYDAHEEIFGFRWFDVDGIGEEAVLRLNGRRIMLKSAISWGYFPATGLAVTEEMAEKQIRVAKELGLNMLNFHRCIGNPIVLEKADEMGLLYYEEPGSFHSANHDPFIRTLVNEKLKRMVRRDRNHPSLVIYNLINEFGGHLSKDKELVAKRMNDMRIAHAVDPSRIMTFTSGWASTEHGEEDSKAHMLPFDSTLYMKGWFDNHRAGGPATWMEEYYQSPDKNFMHTTNRTEIYMRGEEGALSTPPRIQLIHDEIQRSGKTGWDGFFWQDQYRSFVDYFNENNLKPYFGTLDSLTRSMGNISFEHQGRRIQGMRMQNIGDAYMINGWEAMPYDNHSGVVDIYRNPKGDASVLAYYTQPLYVAVSSRNQVIKLPGMATVDFYAINELNLKGSHRLVISVKAPDGKQVFKRETSVDIRGGEEYGQLLLSGVEIPLDDVQGTYRIYAELIGEEQQVCAQGKDEVLGVRWTADDLNGNGAYYGNPNDKVAAFYRNVTGKELSVFDNQSSSLDWLIVNRSSLDEPVAISPDYFKNERGESTLKVTWYSDNDMKVAVSVKADEEVSRTFIGGAQPDESVPANQAFSVVWEGMIYPPETGQYLMGIESNGGMRLYVNGKEIVEDFGNTILKKQSRPVYMEAGVPAKIRVECRQGGKDGQLQLQWSLPTATSISPKLLLDRVKKEGTTLILLGMTETWMQAVAECTGVEYKGYFNVGKNWVGGVHFVKEHPLFEGLPVNDGMNWPYQAVVRDGERRYGFCLKGEEMVAGAYRSTPFNLGTAVGVIPYGKGKIIFSSLDIVDNLDNASGPAEVARKLLCNYIKYALNK